MASIRTGLPRTVFDDQCPQTLALPKEVDRWPLTTPREKLVTIGVNVGAMAGCFLRLAVRVLRAHCEHPVRRMFRLSILYLFVLVAALIVERASTMAIAQHAGGLNDGHGRAGLLERCQPIMGAAGSGRRFHGLIQ